MLHNSQCVVSCRCCSECDHSSCSVLVQ